MRSERAQGDEIRMPTGQPPSGTVFNQAYLSTLDHEASDTPAEAEVFGRQW